jgi:nucleotide-binding universal stress UspA family protein
LPQKDPKAPRCPRTESRRRCPGKLGRVETIFTCILCGVDDTPESIEAVRQARRLASPEAEILLVGVAETALAVDAGWAATRILDELREGELEALDRAKIAAGPHVSTRLLEGVPWSAVAKTAADERVDLVAVGTHERSRAAGIVGGSVATYTVHEAPCTVLVARSSEFPERFPRSILAGFDGSEGGASALALARRLAEETGAKLRILAAAGGYKLELDPVREAAPDAVVDYRAPVDALVEESDLADLVVVGSRGLHGIAALGSVSERVAHQAKSSVLVVRSGPAER